MISFHLKSVPADALKRYYEFAEYYDYEEYEDNEDEETDEDKEKRTSEFDTWQLEETATNSTSFEHDAEQDADFFRSIQHSYLFSPNLEDDESGYGVFSPHDSQFFAQNFKELIEGQQKLQNDLNKYFGDNEKQKEWIKSLISQRLIPFFEKAAANNEGFITEWG